MINISNFINVSLATAPTSITARNVSVVALFTKEPANIPINNYVIYRSPETAANDFGIDSETYKMINAIFSQQPNILTGDGYVVVFPVEDNITVAATSGYTTCKSILYKNFQNISDGSIKVAVDGIDAVAYTGLDFTAIKNINDLVNVLQAKITTCDIAADENNNITFTSKTTGATSKIELSSDETGTDLSTVNLLNIANAEVIAGEAEYTGSERLQDIFNRTQQILYYGCCMATWDPTDAEIEATANMAQSSNSMLAVVKGGANYLITETTNIFYKIQQMSLDHTRCLYYNGETDPLLFMAAYISSYLAVNYGGNNTVKNLHAKELTGVLPDDTIGETELFNCQTIGTDCYVAVGGVGAVYCSGANEWFDTVAGLIWLKMQIEEQGFTTLRNVPTKIPQTEDGVAMLYNTYAKVLNQAVNNGFIAPGSWTLPYTFGNQELMLNNIVNFGYYIYFTPISQQSQTEREARKAPYCQIAIKLAGAINSSNIVINVNN